MTPKTKNILIVGLIAVLAVAAAWGWMRKPAVHPGSYATNFGVPPAYQPNTVPPAQAASSDEPGRPYPGDPGYAQPRVSNGTYSYASSAPSPCVDQAMYAPADVPAYASRGYVRTVRQSAAPDTRYVTRYVERDRAPVYRDRSKKKSALIVAGGAGAGAAIGALAGGGKGAAIGALSGGAGTFIYDRLTHRHRVR